MLDLARHGRDRDRRLRPLPHEQRRDQVVDPETRLGDQAAERRGAAQPPQPAGREITRGGHGGNGCSGLGHGRPAYEPPATARAEVVDQLGDDALGRRAPGLVHAGQAGRPGRLGRRRPDADHVPGHRQRRAAGGPQGQERLRPTRSP